MKRFILYILMITALVISCQPDNEDDIIQDACDKNAIIDGDVFKYDSSEVNINSVTLTNDCLHINYSGSGCNGETWIVELIDSEFIEASNPIRRDILFSLIDNEECEAIITKDISFDLSPLKISNENEIIFRLKGWTDDIQYLY